MIEFSTLPKTWILDVDGTIVKHNGYKVDGYDTLLEGVKDFFDKLPENDKVIFLTARTKDDLQDLILFLKKNRIRYDSIITDITMGERILINDKKPSGLSMAFSINKDRDSKFEIDYVLNEDL